MIIHPSQRHGGHDGDVAIRIAGPTEYDRARAAYQAWGYAGGIRDTDTVFLAERKNDVVGVVRLTVEHGVRMLRGMYVAPAEHRRGIGTGLLFALVDRLSGEECWAVPFSHLLGFYSQGGFVEWPVAEGPPFLADRIDRYRREGHVVTLIRRASAAPALHRGGSDEKARQSIDP